MFPEIIVLMSNAILSVDEGIEANVQSLCITIYIPGGGVVQCELTASVIPMDGTASMQYIVLAHYNMDITSWFMKSVTVEFSMYRLSFFL